MAESPLSEARMPQGGIPTGREQVDHIVETMRLLSRHTDPQAMVDEYSRRMRGLLHFGRLLSISRRGLGPGQYVIARDSQRSEPINPWTQRDRLPVLSGGLLGELLFSNEPALIGDLQVDEDDPGYPWLADARSLMATPVFDGGEVLNMTIFVRPEPDAYNESQLAYLVWTSNLLGRATHNLVLRRQVQEAHDELDREMRIIADLQRSMLPQQLPEMAGLELATWYEPAAYAGGDYYDFFPLPQGKWGILVGDVSGHGSPAAVLMAITHTLAHSLPFDQPGPGQMLDFVNAHLAHHYTPRHGAFVTAFFGVYCPTSRRMVYASAGHEPPRVMRCADGRLFALDDAQSLPLGVMDDTHFNEAQVTLEPGDQLAIYTDGVTDAMNAQRERFGIKRLEAALRNCALSAQAMIDAVRGQVESFSSRRVGVDDRTMVVVRVEE